MDSKVQEVLDRAKKRAENGASSSPGGADGSGGGGPREPDRPTMDSRPTLIMGEPIPQLFRVDLVSIGPFRFRPGLTERKICWMEACLIQMSEVLWPC